METQKKTKIIRNYSILLLVVVFLVGFAIVNRSNDGELNDYEVYESGVIINETNESSLYPNQMLGTQMQDSISSFIFIGIIMVTVAMVMSIVFNIFRTSGY